MCCCMGFVPVSIVPDVRTQDALLHTVGERLVYEAHILSEVCYFNCNHNKRQQPIVSMGRGQGTVCTLLIWTLVLVLPTLSRASKPAIASIGMNSILRMCKFIRWWCGSTLYVGMV